MFIYHFDVLAIVLFILLFLCNNIRTHNKGRANVFFNIMVLISLMASIGDAVSCIGSDYFEANKHNEVIMYVANYVYFFFHTNILPIFFMYCFSSMGLWHIVTRKSWIINSNIALAMLAAVMTFSNISTHKMFTIDENMNYVRGEGVMALYVIAAIIIILDTVVFAKNSKFIRKDKFFVLVMMAPLYTLALLAQAVWANLAIEMFAIAVESMAFFIVIQRDEEYVDESVGSKNYYAGSDSMKRMIYTETPSVLLFMKFVNYRNLKSFLGQAMYESLIKTMSLEIDNITNEQGGIIDKYYLGNGLFAVKSDEASIEMIRDIGIKMREFAESDLLDGDYEIYINTISCIVSCPQDIRDYNTLLTFATTFHKTLPESKGILLYKDFANERAFCIKNEVESIIDRAIRENAFVPMPVPVRFTEKAVDALKDTERAVEINIELNDNRYGYIHMDMIVASAMRSGRNHELGMYLLDKTCGYITGNEFDIDEYDTVFFRSTLAMLSEINFAENYLELLDQYGIEPGKLCLEIEESVDNYDWNNIINNISKLHNAGIRFALIEYGTNYTNLERLTKLPLDYIKLGRAFNKSHDESMDIIKKDTMDMFRAMKKKIMFT